MSWEVLTRTESGGLINTWTVSEHGQEPRPEIFAIREEAEQALAKFLEEGTIAAAAGALETAPDPEDYVIERAFPYQVHRLIWTGIEIEVRYAPAWLGMTGPGLDVAHLEIETIQPQRAPLPITETGYRSHFTSKAAVESYGGPLDFAKAWIEDEAASPEWLAHEASHRQMSLF